MKLLNSKLKSIENFDANSVTLKVLGFKTSHGVKFLFQTQFL